jgi:hypothetical protein
LNVKTTETDAPEVIVLGVKVAPDWLALAAPGVTLNELLVAETPFAVAEILYPVPAFVTESPVNVATPPDAVAVVEPVRDAPPLTASVTTSSALPILAPLASRSSTDTLKAAPAALEAVG